MPTMAAAADPTNDPSQTPQHTGSIYLKDDSLPDDYNGQGPRRSKDDICTILTDIIPRAPTSIVQQRLGYSIHYENDLDLNHFFKSNVIDRLKQQQLLPRLSYETEAKRAIYILNPPTYIYNMTEQQLLPEIEYRNGGIDITRLEKFESARPPYKKYIKITLNQGVVLSPLYNVITVLYDLSKVQCYSS